MARHLAEKVALVTGAARGFGWGIARVLGQHDARVCITDINETELARAAADLTSDDSLVMRRVLDVADREQFQTVVGEVVERWGRLDILVHNAIYMPLVRFDDMRPEVWQRQIDVSLGGLYNATYAGLARHESPGRRTHHRHRQRFQRARGTGTRLPTARQNMPRKAS